MLKKGIATASVGVALGSIATALVYEVGVQLSRADARLDPGTLGRMEDGGIQRLEGAGAAARPSTSLATSAPKLTQRDDTALRKDIEALGVQLKAIETEKGALARRLGQAEAELARREGDGTEADKHRDRDEFDLDREDWKKLAETGSVKFRVPCQRDADWTPSADELNRLGLAPDDAEVIRSAYERSNRRVWSTLRPLCIEAIGNESVVDILGPRTCSQVILTVSKSADVESFEAAMREVAETRAGQRSLPEKGLQKHPVFEMIWTMTGEMPAFEADLAESLGPEDAKRIAYSQSECSQTSSFTNGKSPHARSGNPAGR